MLAFYAVRHQPSYFPLLFPYRTKEERVRDQSLTTREYSTHLFSTILPAPLRSNPRKSYVCHLDVCVAVVKLRAPYRKRARLIASEDNTVLYEDSAPTSAPSRTKGEGRTKAKKGMKGNDGEQEGTHARVPEHRTHNRIRVSSTEHPMHRPCWLWIRLI